MLGAGISYLTIAPGIQAFFIVCAQCALHTDHANDME